MGYFPVSSEHNCSWLRRSNTDRKGAATDVDLERRTTPLPRFSSDVTLVRAGYGKQRVLPNATSAVSTLGSSPLSNAFAPCHASRFSHCRTRHTPCEWDTLAASLPSFHGVGWAEEQGKRSEMEDGTVVIRDFGGMPGAWLLAIYDGHGGRATVSLLLERLHENLLQLLKERGKERWNCLKRQAQRRRCVLVDSLNEQQQRLQEQALCISPRRRRRQCRETREEGQLRPQEGERVLVEEYSGTRTSQHSMPESDSMVDDHVVDHEIRERIDCYWKLLRTQQLLRVLRWMEETGEDLSGEAQNENDPCLPPHYLLVCTEDDVRSAFSDAFRQTDEQLLQNGIVQSGATACVSLLRPSIDFERLLTMKPEEFADIDWQLFCGKCIGFPSRRRRCGKKESADHGAAVRSAAYSQPNVIAGGGEPDAPTHLSAGTPLLSKEAHDVSQEDALQASEPHWDIYCVLPEKSPSSVVSPPVGVGGRVFPSSEAGRGTMKAHAISSLLSVKLSVAHLGDSRALLVALDGSCERLTAATDHKASSSQEVQRVEDAGGWVFGERVNGMLAIGRAFGDWCLKLNPEELKVFSSAALTGINGDCTENISGRDNGTELNTTPGGNDSIEDKAIFRMLYEGIGGGVPNKVEAAAPIPNFDDEGGTEETGDTELKLSGGHTRADKACVRNRGNSLATRNHSSRQHALIVSNEPDICTRDILACQGTNSAKNPAVMTVPGHDDDVGSDAKATARSDYQEVQNVSYGSSVQSCGLPGPPVLLVLGCDGLFDVCSDTAVTAVALEFLRELQDAHPDLTPSNAAEAVARALIEEAITFRGSTDNVSVTVALLLPMDFCGKDDGDER